jgi:magnesium-transporting ATPase (P-type)
MKVDHFLNILPRQKNHFYLLFQTNLGDTQFLYIDLAITTTVAVLMGWTEGHTQLVPQRPQGSLIAGSNLFSIFSQILITTLVQVI